jgi:hypothetical protein
MIISASYKTDIPTFYGKWFLNRLNAGYCKMINPYGRQIYEVSLKREDVDGFVFWTKNIGPFMNVLEIVRMLGYPFMVQHTIHNYPKELERSVIDFTKSVNFIKNLAEQYGPAVAVWRYDPIIFTSITPFDFHLKNFERLASELEGSTDEVVISFAQIYRKSKNNLEKAAKAKGFTWEDPDDNTKLQLASDLAEIARHHEMQLTMCSQSKYSQAKGVKEARCVDALRLSHIGGFKIRAKLKGNREDCGCYESKDIGDYDTCPHGCVYCYAVHNWELALRRYREHDPNSEFLHAPKGKMPKEINETDAKERTLQSRLQ